MPSVTMKHLVLTLSLLMVNNVACLKLKPEVLLPDLGAISNYFDNIDNSLEAYIHWPKEITFRVRRISENESRYLKIDGTFQSSKLGLAVESFDGLYNKNARFYVKNKSNGSMNEISGETSLAYSKQPNIINPGTSFISIRYFGPNEIKPLVQSNYEQGRSYYERVLPTNLATFLLTPPGTNHFLEYSVPFDDISKQNAKVKGGLRVLMSNKLMPNLRVKKARRASKLLIDPKTFRVSIPEDYYDGCLVDCENFFGVRMGNVGFLAEHRGSDVRMLSSDDIAGENKDPERYIINEIDFSFKLNGVEPTKGGLSDVLTSTPKSGKFQINGHVLVKYLNLSANNNLDPQCPFVIKFENTGSYFLFGSNKEPAKEACANSNRVWPKGGIRPNKEYIPIILKRPLYINVKVNVACKIY